MTRQQPRIRAVSKPLIALSVAVLFTVLGGVFAALAGLGWLAVLWLIVLAGEALWAAALIRRNRR